MEPVTFRLSSIFDEFPHLASDSRLTTMLFILAMIKSQIRDSINTLYTTTSRHASPYNPNDVQDLKAQLSQLKEEYLRDLRESTGILAWLNEFGIGEDESRVSFRFRNIYNLFDARPEIEVTFTLPEDAIAFKLAWLGGRIPHVK